MLTRSPWLSAATGTITTRAHKARSDAGAAVVELALVLPLLLAILLGIFDFGRALNYWNDANHLAAEGARSVAVNSNPGGLTQFQSWLATKADTGELKTGSENVVTPLRVCVSFTDTNGDGTTTNVGDAVNVRVFAQYALLPLVDLGTVVDLKGEATMRLEQKVTKIAAVNNPPQC